MRTSHTGTYSHTMLVRALLYFIRSHMNVPMHTLYSHSPLSQISVHSYTHSVTQSAWGMSHGQSAGRTLFCLCVLGSFHECGRSRLHQSSPQGQGGIGLSMLTCLNPERSQELPQPPLLSASPPTLLWPPMDPLCTQL